MNFYLEIAKMRAARLLWCRIMKGFGAKNPKSLMLRTHSQTSGWSLTEQDPYNNVVRTTIEAMAAVFRRHAEPAHQRSTKPSRCPPSSARIARNTQLIIQEETHITSVIDPWAGSYMMEKLTQDMADKAWAIIEEGRRHGRHDPRPWTAAGPSSRSRPAPPRSRRASTRARRHRRRQQVQAGEGRPDRDPGGRTTSSVREARSPACSHQGQPRQRRCRPRWRADRAARKAARGNLLDLSIQAIRLRATVGEVSDALESVFGRHRADIQKVTGVYAAAYDSAEAGDKLQGRDRRLRRGARAAARA